MTSRNSTSQGPEKALVADICFAAVEPQMWTLYLHFRPYDAFCCFLYLVNSKDSKISSVRAALGGWEMFHVTPVSAHDPKIK